MLVNAKTLADINQKRNKFHWRGYYTHVEPNEPPFTKLELKKRLSEALCHVTLPTEEEREVFL